MTLLLALIIAAAYVYALFKWNDAMTIASLAAAAFVIVGVLAYAALGQLGVA